jgi:hypothetical protein
MNSMGVNFDEARLKLKLSFLEESVTVKDKPTK